MGGGEGVRGPWGDYLSHMRTVKRQCSLALCNVECACVWTGRAGRSDRAAALRSIWTLSTWRADWERLVVTFFTVHVRAFVCSQVWGRVQQHNSLAVLQCHRRGRRQPVLRRHKAPLLQNDTGPGEAPRGVSEAALQVRRVSDSERPSASFVRPSAEAL